jgi:RND family efflux transporter MFP subunit
VRTSSCVALLLAGASCHKGAEAPEQAPALAVKTAKVERGDVPRVVTLAGTLEPPPGLDVKLAPLVQGRLAQVLVAEGDHVRKGQPLARLEATPLRDALTQAQAQLAQARAQENNTRTRLSRAQQAFDAGVAAGQEVDDARLAEESARAAVRTAEAAVSTAGNQVQRGELRAPFDGVVAKISAASGEPVDPSRTVVEVARVEVLELRAPVSPTVGALLRPGQRARVNSAQASADGVVFAVSPVVDAVTGAVVVRIRLPNDDGAFKANSAAHGSVVADVHHGALWVPKPAVIGADEKASVEIVDAGKAKAVEVKTGYDDGSRVEIVDGLKGDETVIVQGGYAVPDGTPIAAEADAGPSETRPARAEEEK